MRTRRKTKKEIHLGSSEHVKKNSPARSKDYHVNSNQRLP